MVSDPAVFEPDKAINETDEGLPVASSDQLTACVSRSDQLSQRDNVAVGDAPDLLLEIFHDPHVVEALDVFNDDRALRISISM
jgi:hypothetical protein